MKSLFVIGGIAVAAALALTPDLKGG